MKFKVGDILRNQYGSTTKVLGVIPGLSYRIYTADNKTEYNAEQHWVERFFRKLTKLEKALK